MNPYQHPALSDEQVRALQAAFLGGADQLELAGLTGLSSGTVNHAVRGRGSYRHLPGVPRHLMAGDGALERQIKALAALGVSPTQIGKRLGIHPHRLKRIVPDLPWPGPKPRKET